MTRACLRRLTVRRCPRQRLPQTSIRAPGHRAVDAQQTVAAPAPAGDSPPMTGGAPPAPADPAPPTHRKRPWGWIAVAGLLAACVIGLAIYALNLNADIDDADAQIASQQEQIDQAQETASTSSRPRRRHSTT